MSQAPPRWRRRSAERPAEIVEAALAVFAESGFAAARLETIAARAGVSKATLYLYFDSKEALFRASVRAAAAPLLAAVDAAGGAGAQAKAPFGELLPLLLGRAAALLDEGHAAALARMVIAESRTFPDLARIWRENVVGPALGRIATLIAGAQQRGEIAPGDSRLIGFSVVGPVILGALYREVFGALPADAPDLPALAAHQAAFAARALAPSSDEGDS